ncbi:DUF2975 domain-containing protein [Novosphingobium mangrovi (ex Huang et al. 2023)]|uniref:DUF2975 domain-containing protein n=1 Tax=Novosphingobium mangrovi (ex Huang et al. 2023) TaxID=2976432 RepID=A0ABT2I2L8_9SPHN|nr:DUF2975 domain-containing protein [Novosphingobium mangrovi (ex Huang et al. 2023)]MCT2399047.1 DUF2975 domain-containing protein [Novosphingobium mangrovi (ex Huang et al. 2023)]
MTSITRDPLLAIAKGILWLLMGVMVLAAIATIVAVPAVLVMRDQIMVDLAKEMPGLDAPHFVLAIAAVCLLAAILLALLFRIFQLLKQIVDTVGAGDPFVPVNARRLTQMAWLTLAVQVVSLPLTRIGMWIHEVTKGAGADGVDIRVTGVDGNGLLLVLILFILARVFRKGAEMRAELEGTV